MYVSLFASRIGWDTNLKRGSSAFENLGRDLARGFLEVCDRVDVVFPKGKAFPGHSLPEGVRLVPLRSRRVATTAIPLAAYLRREQPDALISLGMLLQNPPTVLAGRLARWPGVAILHHQTHIGYKSRVEHRGDVRFRILPVLVSLLYSRADGISAVSPSVLKDALKQARLDGGQIPTRAIPNPVDIDRVQRKASEPLSHPWFSDKSVPVILSVGRLARQKNPVLLIDAFARLLEEREARLIILGEGPLRGDVEAKVREMGIHESVDMLGFVDNPFAYMANADVFALSSEEEGFGLVLVEAMASRCPVVSTACPGGPVEILENGRSGLLAQPGDIEALHRALASVLEDSSLRGRLIDEGMRRANEFSPRAVAGEWLSFIEQARLRKLTANVH
jgi:glycosyltransferase involved in cell wall biosynthesis